MHDCNSSAYPSHNFHRQVEPLLACVRQKGLQRLELLQGLPYGIQIKFLINLTVEHVLSWGVCTTYHEASKIGHCFAGEQNLELGCAAGVLWVEGLQLASPVQLVTVVGAFGSGSPSHHTPPSLVLATLVNTVSLNIVAIATGFVLSLVPGATPKNPFSGLIAEIRKFT